MSTPEIIKLKKRLSALEAKSSKQSEPGFDDLLKSVMTSMLEVDKHFDDKASRVLSAMAFLTAGAAAIFTKAYSPNLPLELVKEKLQPVLTPEIIVAIEKQQWSVSSANIAGVDWALITFSAYMLFVLVGSVLYLSALGPFLNISKAWKNDLKQDRSCDRSKPLPSLHFFYFVSEILPEEWLAYWTKDRSAEEIEAEVKANNIRESLKIAQNAKAKYNFMRVGNVFFVIAIFCLMALIAGLTSKKILIVFLITALGWFVLSLTLTFVTQKRPPKEYSPAFWCWAVMTMLSFVSALLLLCKLR